MRKNIFTIILIFSLILALENITYAQKELWIDGTPLIYEEAQSIARIIGTGNQFLQAPALNVDKPAAFDIGDKQDFFALNMQKMSDYILKATLRAVSDKAYIFVEDGRTVSDKKINSLLESFDKIYDKITSIFGPLPDGIDGDPRVYLLIMDIIDRANIDGTRIAGYFSPINSYRSTQLGKWTKQRSNEVEMLYIDNLYLEVLKDGGASIVAHEFMHLVQWIRDPLEATWVNEGIAMYAETIMGYSIKDYITAFEKNPDVSLLNWTGGIESYGASYLFFAYLSERFGGDSVIAAIVKNTDQGTTGIEKALSGLGKDISFDRLFSDWSIANYLDNPSIYDGIYGYVNLDIKLKSTNTESQYPLALKESSIKSWSAHYIEFNKKPGETLDLVVQRSDRNDIFAQIIITRGNVYVSQIKSGIEKIGTATIPDVVNKGVLVITCQPNPPNSIRLASNYRYSAEVNAEPMTTSVTTNGRKTTTWGEIKK
ncbi:hypothetical protein FJZ33_02310 [Candidatus Poribacteria bacterium]|nr:hypothetical protein [Candidatus Poribacteria bacterium]